LTQAIALGTPLAEGARLRMHGTIKLGRWLPFRAEQILNPRAGFIWAARIAGVIVGSDQYLDHVGCMNWKLGGLVPVAKAQGPDVSLSAAGRAVGEAVCLPTSTLPRYGVRWSAQDDTHITAHHQLDGMSVALQHTLDLDGATRAVVFQRWGDPERTGNWSLHPFGGEFTGWRTFGGLTIPSTGRMGWHFGTDRWREGEFFRFTITGLRPLRPTEVGLPEAYRLRSG
jgi:hypothetical protein